jgi:hypothetical protein
MSKSTKTNSSKLTSEMIDQKLETFKNVSSKIRYLNSLGMDRSTISKKLNIRYQHVRNVLITPVQKQKEDIN